MANAPPDKSLLSPKKTMTSLDLMAWLNENGALIQTARINNVYRIEGTPSVFMLKLHTRTGTRFLVLEPAVRIHFTIYKLPTPPQPDGLTMALRRHIRGAIVREVSQIGFDRILVMTLSNNNRLVLELLPRGVLAVTNPEGKILVASEYKEMRDRTIKPGYQYAFPPHISEAPTLEKCSEIVKEGERKLAKTMGLPQEIIREAGVRMQNTGKGLCEELIGIIEESLSGKGYLVRQGEKQEPVFFSPYRPTFIHSTQEHHPRLIIEEKESFNEAVDSFFSHGIALRISEEKTKEDAERKSRLETRLEKERKLVEEYLKLSEELYARANLMMSYRFLLEDVLECVNNVRKTQGWEKLPEKCNAVKEAHPSKGKVIVELNNGERLELAVNVPLKEQIAEYYERAKKLRKKAESAKKHLEELRARLEEHQRRAEETARMIVKTVRKREWYENYWWSITRNGHLVIAGRDASQNEAIVRKHMGPKDVFLHADIHGAPATLLKNVPDDGPHKEDLEDAAVIAASYSKAWKDGLVAVDVFWVRSDQVSKSPPSGEYLPKGSFMIYGKKNYIRKVPLRLTVGVQEWGGGLRYLIGNYEAVKEHSTPLGIITPGDIEREKIAKKIAEKAWKKGIQTPPPHELANLIPGRARIHRLL